MIDDFDLIESEFYLFGIPAAESLSAIPLPTKKIKIKNLSSVNYALQFYEDTSLIPYSIIINSMKDKYKDDGFIKLIDKSFEKYMPNIIKQESLEIEKLISRFEKTESFYSKITDLAKREYNPKVLADNSMKEIEKIRKKGLSDIIDTAYIYKSNSRHRSSMTNNDISQYFACKFVVMNYDIKLIYPNLRILAYEAQQARKDWDYSIKEDGIDLFKFTRLQYIDTVDSAVINYVNSFQTNPWIEEYLSDKISSKL